jgi:hypothetical protein
MSTQAGFALRGRNPDVLTCIANLSNDEVFTPPEFANRMMDTLAEAWAANKDGANIWADKTVEPGSVRVPPVRRRVPSVHGHREPRGPDPLRALRHGGGEGVKAGLSCNHRPPV